MQATALAFLYIKIEGLILWLQSQSRRASSFIQMNKIKPEWTASKVRDADGSARRRNGLLIQYFKLVQESKQKDISSDVGMLLLRILLALQSRTSRISDAGGVI